jgi:endonuclease YncB( thermonuclease family)
MDVQHHPCLEIKVIAYGPSKKYDKEFKEAERQARKQGLGIWADPELTQKYLRLKSKWGQKRS